MASYDPARGDVRHFRLDRIKSASASEEHFVPRADVDPAADVDGWPRTGEVPASRQARVWISPQRARWAQEERTVVSDLDDGSVIVALRFAGVDWLVREVLKEAGDAVVLEPPMLAPPCSRPPRRCWGPERRRRAEPAAGRTATDSSDRPRAGRPDTLRAGCNHSRA